MSSVLQNRETSALSFKKLISGLTQMQVCLESGTKIQWLVCCHKVFQQQIQTLIQKIKTLEFQLTLLNSEQDQFKKINEELKKNKKFHEELLEKSNGLEIFAADVFTLKQKSMQAENISGALKALIFRTYDFIFAQKDSENSVLTKEILQQETENLLSFLDQKRLKKDRMLPVFENYILDVLFHSKYFTSNEKTQEQYKNLFHWNEQCLEETCKTWRMILDENQLTQQLKKNWERQIEAENLVVNIAKEEGNTHIFSFFNHILGISDADHLYHQYQSNLPYRLQQKFIKYKIQPYFLDDFLNLLWKDYYENMLKVFKKEENIKTTLTAEDVYSQELTTALSVLVESASLTANLELDQTTHKQLFQIAPKFQHLVYEKDEHGSYILEEYIDNQQKKFRFKAKNYGAIEGFLKSYQGGKTQFIKEVTQESIFLIRLQLETLENNKKQKIFLPFLETKTLASEIWLEWFSFFKIRDGDGKKTITYWTNQDVKDKILPHLVLQKNAQRAYMQSILGVDAEFKKQILEPLLGAKNVAELENILQNHCIFNNNYDFILFPKSLYGSFSAENTNIHIIRERLINAKNTAQISYFLASNDKTIQLKSNGDKLQIQNLEQLYFLVNHPEGLLNPLNTNVHKKNIELNFELSPEIAYLLDEYLLKEQLQFILPQIVISNNFSPKIPWTRSALVPIYLKEVKFIEDNLPTLNRKLIDNLDNEVLFSYIQHHEYAQLLFKTDPEKLKAVIKTQAKILRKVLLEEFTHFELLDPNIRVWKHSELLALNDIRVLLLLETDPQQALMFLDNLPKLTQPKLLLSSVFSETLFKYFGSAYYLEFFKYHGLKSIYLIHHSTALRFFNQEDSRKIILSEIKNLKRAHRIQLLEENPNQIVEAIIKHNVYGFFQLLPQAKSLIRTQSTDSYDQQRLNLFAKYKVAINQILRKQSLDTVSFEIQDKKMSIVIDNLDKKSMPVEKYFRQQSVPNSLCKLKNLKRALDFQDFPKLRKNCIVLDADNPDLAIDLEDSLSRIKKLQEDILIFKQQEPKAFKNNFKIRTTYGKTWISNVRNLSLRAFSHHIGAVYLTGNLVKDVLQGDCTGITINLQIIGVQTMAAQAKLIDSTSMQVFGKFAEKTNTVFMVSASTYDMFQNFNKILNATETDQKIEATGDIALDYGICVTAILDNPLAIALFIVKDVYDAAWATYRRITEVNLTFAEGFQEFAYALLGLESDNYLHHLEAQQFEKNIIEQYLKHHFNQFSKLNAQPVLWVIGNIKNIEYSVRVEQKELGAVCKISKLECVKQALLNAGKPSKIAYKKIENKYNETLVLSPSNQNVSLCFSAKPISVYPQATSISLQETADFSIHCHGVNKDQTTYLWHKSPDHIRISEDKNIRWTTWDKEIKMSYQNQDHSCNGVYVLKNKNQNATGIVAFLETDQHVQLDLENNPEHQNIALQTASFNVKTSAENTSIIALKKGSENAKLIAGKNSKKDQLNLKNFMLNIDNLYVDTWAGIIYSYDPNSEEKKTILLTFSNIEMIQGRNSKQDFYYLKNDSESKNHIYFLDSGAEARVEIEGATKYWQKIKSNDIYTKNPKTFIEISEQQNAKIHALSQEQAFYLAGVEVEQLTEIFFTPKALEETDDLFILQFENGTKIYFYTQMRIGLNWLMGQEKYHLIPIVDEQNISQKIQQISLILYAKKDENKNDFLQRIQTFTLRDLGAKTIVHGYHPKERWEIVYAPKGLTVAPFHPEGKTLEIISLEGNNAFRLFPQEEKTSLSLCLLKPCDPEQDLYILNLSAFSDDVKLSQINYQFLNPEQTELQIKMLIQSQNHQQWVDYQAKIVEQKIIPNFLLQLPKAQSKKINFNFSSLDFTKKWGILSFDIEETVTLHQLEVESGHRQENYQLVDAQELLDLKLARLVIKNYLIESLGIYKHEKDLIFTGYNQNDDILMYRIKNFNLILEKHQSDAQYRLEIWIARQHFSLKKLTDIYNNTVDFNIYPLDVFFQTQETSSQRIYLLDKLLDAAQLDWATKPHPRVEIYNNLNPETLQIIDFSTYHIVEPITWQDDMGKKDFSFFVTKDLENKNLYLQLIFKNVPENFYYLSFWLPNRKFFSLASYQYNQIFLDNFKKEIQPLNAQVKKLQIPKKPVAAKKAKNLFNNTTPNHFLPYIISDEPSTSSFNKFENSFEEQAENSTNLTLTQEKFLQTSSITSSKTSTFWTWTKYLASGSLVLGAFGLAVNYGKWFFSRKKLYQPVPNQILTTAVNLNLLQESSCEHQVSKTVLNFKRSDHLLVEVQDFVAQLATSGAWKTINDKNSTLIQEQFQLNAQEVILRTQEFKCFEAEKKLILTYFLQNNIKYKEEIVIKGENKDYWQAELTFPLTSAEKQNYRNASLLWHPDRCVENSELCLQNFNNLQTEYQTIWQSERQNLPIHYLHALDQTAVFNTPGGWQFNPQIDKKEIFINTFLANKMIFSDAINQYLKSAIPNLILPQHWTACLLSAAIKLIEQLYNLQIDVKNWVPELNQSLNLTFKYLILKQLKNDYPNLTEKEIKKTKEYQEKCKLCENLSKILAYFFAYSFSVFEILACFSVGHCYSGIEKTLLLVSHFLGTQTVHYCFTKALSCLTAQELYELKNLGISGLCRETLNTWQKITYAMIGIDPYVKSNKIPEKPRSKNSKLSEKYSENLSVVCLDQLKNIPHDLRKKNVKF